jgi:hypothetical protein
MPVRPYLRRFVRKFVFDVIPGSLASLVGAILFSQYWAQPQAPARLVDIPRVAQQSEQIVQMIRDEHALMVEFLKKEQQREIARQPLSVKDMKAMEPAVAVPARRSVEAAAEPKALAPLPPAKPEVEVVAIESGPLVAPEPKPVGAFARIATVASALTDKAVDLTGVRLIPALIRGIPARADMIGDELDAATGGRFISASR